MRLPGYAKALAEYRATGKPLDALVVSIHDWDDGYWFDHVPTVKRLVIPEDLPVVEVDWAPVTTADVILCGGSDSDFYAAAQLVRAAMAASVWGQFADGFWLLEAWPYGSKSIATAGPFAERELLNEIRCNRDVALMQGAGVYGLPLFREARVRLWGRAFGPEVEARLRQKVPA